MKRLINFILIVVLLPTLTACQKTENEIIILPKDYIGYILIIYDQENGEKAEYRDETRIYHIPESGILKTQFSPNPGWMDFPKIYYESINDSSKIPYNPDLKNLPEDRIVVYGGTAGGVNRDLAGKEVVRFVEYFVGNKEQIKEAMRAAEKLDVIKIADEKK